MLERTKVHRQHQLEYVAAIQDARFGVNSTILSDLMNARSVDCSRYAEIETKVLHLVPAHAQVLKHNNRCLRRLSQDGGLRRAVAVDFVALDWDSDDRLDAEASEMLIKAVDRPTLDAALADCMAPAVVPHCLNARVLYTSNAKLALGIFHGYIGFVSLYTPDGTAVRRLPNMRLPTGARLKDVYDAGDD